MHHPTDRIIHTTAFVTLEREMFYLTMHSTHFIYGYMASDIWLRTILIVRKETRCRHIGYSYRLTARVLLYASSHRQDNTYHGLCYTSRGALAGTRNSSMGPPHEGLIEYRVGYCIYYPVYFKNLKVKLLTWHKLYNRQENRMEIWKPMTSPNVMTSAGKNSFYLSLGKKIENILTRISLPTWGREREKCFI